MMLVTQYELTIYEDSTQKNGSNVRKILILDRVNRGLEPVDRRRNFLVGSNRKKSLEWGLYDR